jgi:hypothetical protein
LHISPAQHKSAGEFVDLVASKLGSGRAVQSETAIASSARLAGSLLFRSFELNIQLAQPGSIILSDEANEQGPQLIGTMSALLQHFNVSLSEAKLGSEPSKRGSPPQLSPLESLSLLQEEALQIARSNGLSLKEAAHAAAMATAFILKECAPSIGSEVGFNIAAYSFIEGCKTVPPIIGLAQAQPTGKKPWYKLW